MNRNLDLELTLITARLYKYLKIKSGVSLDILNVNFSKLDMLFIPQLILLVSQNGKGFNNKTRTLAVVSQIMYLSTEIHNQIPENEDTSFRENIQLPILVGDLLYSKFFEILCTEDSIEYLDYFVEYVSQLNENWVEFLDNKISLEDLCLSWYGELGNMVINIASKVNGMNSYWLKVLKRYGFNISCLFGAHKLGLREKNINFYWLEVQEAIKLMPPGELRDKLNNFAHNIFNTLFNNPAQEEFNFSVAAER